MRQTHNIFRSSLFHWIMCEPFCRNKNIGSRITRKKKRCASIVSLETERMFRDNLTYLCLSTKTSTFGRLSGEDHVKGCSICMKLHSCTTEIRTSKIVLQTWTMAAARVKHAAIPRWFPIDRFDWCKCTELSEKRGIFTVSRDHYNGEYRFFVFAIVFEGQRLPQIFLTERCIFFHVIWKRVCKYNDWRGRARCITKELLRILRVDAILLRKKSENTYVLWKILRIWKNDIGYFIGQRKL